jgi:hypothetical protein
MTAISTKIHTRLVAGLKKYQSVLTNAKSKDINESDTVLIISDMLADIFGYDKYSEITSEYAVKKTFCDLTIKIESKVHFLIEVKAIGLDLKEDHIRQALDYGSNLGVDWIVLTNGIVWKLYKVIFGKPVMHELVFEFNMITINYKKDSDLDLLFCLCKESLGKSVLEDFHAQKQALNRFYIGQIILTDSVIEAIRKTLKKTSPDIKPTYEDIESLLRMEVLKREILEGDKMEEAKKRIQKAFRAIEKKAAQVAKKEDGAELGNTGTFSIV